MPYQASVSGIIFNKEQSELLLIQRRDNPIWVLPGGGVDPNETPEDAIIREIHEETGLEVRLKRKVGEYTPINMLTNFTHLYELEVINGTPQKGDETRNIGYFPLTKLPKSFFFLHHDYVEDARRNHPYIIRKPILQSTYWTGFKYLLRHPIQSIRYFLAKLGLPINT